MRTSPKTLFRALTVPSLECASIRLFVKLLRSNQSRRAEVPAIGLGRLLTQPKVAGADHFIMLLD